MSVMNRVFPSLSLHDGSFHDLKGHPHTNYFCLAYHHLNRKGYNYRINFFTSRKFDWRESNYKQEEKNILQ